MKKLFATISIFSLITIMAAGMARAAEEVTVTATVTVQNISLTITDGTISYGTLGQNSTQNTLPSGVNDMQTVTNNGNVVEDFNIKGTNSANWTLGTTPGENIYTHHFCNDTDNDCSNPLTNYTALTTTYTTLDTNVPVNGTVDIQFQVNTPNPSTYYSEQHVNVIIQAVAS